MKKLGIITYHHPHLKTEQVLIPLVQQQRYDITIYALPYNQRTKRDVLFAHRPDQNLGAHPQEMANYFNLPYIICDNDTDIDNSCELYLILGAGILSADVVTNKAILNIHPGILPAARGLDAFKWSLYDDLPLGVTMHYIDPEVDAGKVISVVPTPRFGNDSLSTLATRHYHLEIQLCTHFQYYLENSINIFIDLPQGKVHKRMPNHLEQELIASFADK